MTGVYYPACGAVTLAFCETTVQENWLPAETVRVILLPAETLGRKLNHTDSLCRKLFTKHNTTTAAATAIVTKIMFAEANCHLIMH